MATDLGQLIYTLNLDDEGFAEKVGAADDSMKSMADTASETGTQMATSATEGADALDKQTVAAQEAATATDEAGAAAAEGSKGFSLLSGGMLKSLAPLAAMFIGFQGLKSVFDDGKQELAQYQNAQAQLKNTLKNTHDQVGMNIQQLDKLSESTSDNTDFTKAQNLTVESALATIGGMNKDTMPKAISLTDDLATKMALMHGQSVPTMQQTAQAARLMARALNNPATAATAFTRAGVTMTAMQQANLKAVATNTNATEAQAYSIAGVTREGAKALSVWSYLTPAQQALERKTQGLTTAQITQAKAFGTQNAGVATQKLLMNDLTNYVGGAATTAAQTYEGRVAMLKKNMGEWSAQIIQVGEHALTNLASHLMVVVSWLEKHKRGVMQVVKVLGPLAAGILAVVVGMKIWEAATEAMKAAQEALAAVMDMNPWILAIMAIVALALLLVTHWKTVKKWFDDFTKEVKHLFDDAVNFIKQHWELLLGILIAPLAPVLLLWKYFHTEIIATFKKAVSDIEGVWNAIVGFFSRIISTIRNAIVGGVKDFGTLLFDAGKNLIMGLVNGVKNMAGHAANAVKDVGKGVINVAKDIFKVFSPSRIFEEIGGFLSLGLAQGITKHRHHATTAAHHLAHHTTRAARVHIPRVHHARVRSASTSGVSSLSSSTTSTSNSGITNYNFHAGAVILNTADAVSEFFNIGNRNTALEANGTAPLTGTIGN